jgi:hypothetical protein
MFRTGTQCIVRNDDIGTKERTRKLSYAHLCRYDLLTTTFTVSFKLFMTKSSFITTVLNLIYSLRAGLIGKYHVLEHTK